MTAVARIGMQLNWAAATDIAAIGYYIVKRNGIVVILRKSAVNHLDQQLTPATPYDDVIAVGTNSNPPPPLALTATTLL